MSYSFSSSNNQYLSTTSSPVTTKPLTIAVWFYTGNTSGNTAMVALDLAGAPAEGFRLFTTNQTVRASEAKNGSGVNIDATANYSTNTWSHAAAVWVDGNFPLGRIYLNGGNSALATAYALYDYDIAANQILIGSRTNTTTGLYFNGYLADIGIWNVALTAGEIAMLSKGFACNKVRPQKLVFYAPLVRNSIDLRNGRTITNNNTATVSDHPRIYI